MPLHVQLSSSTAATGGGAGGAGGAGAGSLTRKDTGDTLFAELDQNTQHLTVPLPKEYDAETTMLYGNFNFSTFCLVNYTDPMQWKTLVTKMVSKRVRRRSCLEEGAVIKREKGVKSTNLNIDT